MPPRSEGHASAIALLKQSLARSKNSCARVVSVVRNPCQQQPLLMNSF